ncbi:methionyl-tRNA formyltransferase [Enterovirga rhinocerotis]|uniref:Methionyl-tRNA formyltransferase n=1 Tax=Enterovirga rhinocerotis TaxID=1339210 RepID=A0A4R7BR57_9HYPH|nr:methionyl-tRNA formyltransferase [Enterovirga rhinocerotis]TDR88128.1 methionyl-tRNA formyltransferase [Enterovirga rhinocerotis]
MSLRVVFMGTPAFAVPVMEAVAEAGHAIVAAYTRAPAATGRGLKQRPSPVHQAAEGRGIPVLTPPNFRDPADRAGFEAREADVAVVVAYGLLLPKPILDAPRLGCLNLHASLLPRWRGAAPIHRAVMAGDAETGVAVMRMEEGLDTGPIGLETRIPIGRDQTTGDLHDILAAEGARLMAEALGPLEAGTLAFRPQPEDGVTYARKIGNEEARIDWSQPAGRVHDLVRGLSPAPGAYVELDLGRGPERIKILRGKPEAGSGEPGTVLPGGLIACADGAYRPLLVQRPGKGPIEADAFWRGVKPAA